jgi:MFS transporter, DHA1 family, multidrug/chloramphenicol efflux transport protein
MALHAIISRWSLHKILKTGIFICVISLFLCLLPLAFRNAYFWMMPGLILYFFALGVANGPLMRLVLFSTTVSKGTASALTSLITMLLLALGIEIGNLLYDAYLLPALLFYFAGCAVFLWILVWFAFIRNAPDQSSA